MKENYEAYKLLSQVYAISRWYKDGKPTNSCEILPAVVEEINLKQEGINIHVSYWLATPNGKEWGDSIDSEYVSDDFNELVLKMKKVWEDNAEEF